MDINGRHKYALLMDGITSNKCIEGYEVLICPECGNMMSMGLKYRKEYNGETAHKRDDGTVVYMGQLEMATPCFVEKGGGMGYLISGI